MPASRSTQSVVLAGRVQSSEVLPTPGGPKIASVVLLFASASRSSAVTMCSAITRPPNRGGSGVQDRASRRRSNRLDRQIAEVERAMAALDQMDLALFRPPGRQRRRSWPARAGRPPPARTPASDPRSAGRGGIRTTSRTRHGRASRGIPQLRSDRALQALLRSAEVIAAVIDWLISGNDSASSRRVAASKGQYSRLTKDNENKSSQ